MNLPFAYTFMSVKTHSFHVWWEYFWHNIWARDTRWEPIGLPVPAPFVGPANLPEFLQGAVSRTREDNGIGLFSPEMEPTAGAGISAHLSQDGSDPPSSLYLLGPLPSRTNYQL